MILNAGEYIRTGHEHIGGIESGQLIITWRKCNGSGSCLDMGIIRTTPTQEQEYTILSSLPILEAEQAMQDYIVANF